MTSRHLSTFVVLLLVSVSACNKEQETSGQRPAPALTQGSLLGSAAGISWRVPGRWTAGPARQMRVATYSIPSQDGGAEGGECGVFYFGPSEGGDVEANMARWIGQFEPSGNPDRSSRTVDDMKVHLIDLSGVYLTSSGPMMGGPKERKEGYRLLGAIVEGTEGSVFFKLTGPSALVETAGNEFDMLVGSFSRM